MFSFFEDVLPFVITITICLWSFFTDFSIITGGIESKIKMTTYIDNSLQATMTFLTKSGAKPLQINEQREVFLVPR